MSRSEMTPLMRRALDLTIAGLTDEFHGIFSPGTVARYVDESWAQLGGRATVGPNFMPVIVDRFARERLWAVAQAEHRVVETRARGVGRPGRAQASQAADGDAAPRPLGRGDGLRRRLALRADGGRGVGRSPTPPAAGRGAEIRACADAVLGRYDDVVVGSHVMTLAHRQTRDCLDAERCYELDPAS